MKKMRKIFGSVINTGNGTRNEYDIVCSRKYSKRC